MWSSIIGAGLTYLGARKESKAREAAAREQSEALQEAAQPRSVYDPLGQAVYNPATDSYELMTSPQLAQLQQGLFFDAMRERANIEPYLTRGGFESEVARRSREEENLIKQATAEALDEVQGKLLKRGTLGTTMGQRGLSEVARRGAEARIGARQSQRGLLSGEITDALNRASAARAGMLGIGTQPQALANIGQGMANSALTAASGAAPSILQSQNLAASAMSQPFYQIGNRFMGAVPQQQGMFSTIFGG